MPLVISTPTHQVADSNNRIVDFGWGKQQDNQRNNSSIINNDNFNPVE